MDNLREILQGEVKKRHKRKPKNFRRNNYLIVFYSLVAVTLIVLMSPLFMPRSLDAEVHNDNQSIVNSTRIIKLRTYFNKHTHTVKTKFYVGNPDNVDDVSSAKDLTNIKYSVRNVTLNGNQLDLKTKLTKYNDNYFEVITKGVADDFKIIRYDIGPSRINKKLETNMSPNISIKLYAKQDQIKNVDYDLTPNLKEMNDSYVSYIINSYKKQIKKLKNKNIKATDTIKQDRSVITKLEVKKASSLGEASDDIEDQITNAKSDISLQNASIQANKNEITEYQNKIKKVE